jgi:3-hydroxybutyryl-CoA dehydrogenase
MKKVLVVGEASRLDEFKRLNLQNAEVTFREYLSLDSVADQLDDDDDDDFDDDDDLIFDQEDEDEEESETLLFDLESEEDEESSNYDIVFDLNFDDEEDSLSTYLFNEGQIVIACAVKRPLSALVGPWEENCECKVFGMNAFPTFISRPKLEMSMLDRRDHKVLEATMKTLGLDYELVDDQVGMVTPRIISMIINEAAFVLGEGTADAKAIDQAMKLGTNYPKGPLEWCDEIGVHNVFELLEALQLNSGDGKYKIAPALRKANDRDLLFHPVS